MISLNFDNVMYQTTAIFKTNSDFLYWNRFQQIVEGILFNYFKIVSKGINPNLGGGRGNFTPSPYWFSLNNS